MAYIQICTIQRTSLFLNMVEVQEINGEKVSQPPPTPRISDLFFLTYKIIF